MIIYSSSIIIWSFYNLLQDHYSSLLLLSVDLRVSYFFIRFHWSWNLYWGVIESCQWDISKTDIQISFSYSFVEVVAWVPVFFIAPVAINTLIIFNSVPHFWQFWLYCWRFIWKHHRRLFLLLVLLIYNHHRIFFHFLTF